MSTMLAEHPIHLPVAAGLDADLTVPAHAIGMVVFAHSSADPMVLDLNRQALQHLRVEAELEVVPGATHLFEEPGALEAVARLAAGWFGTHLTAAATTPSSPSTRPAP